MQIMISECLQNNPWIIHLIHFGLAILLFFIMNWIGKNSISIGYMQLSVVFETDSAPAFNFIFKVLGPVVYLILCVVLFQTIGLNILVDKCYFIVIYYWAFRFLWNLVANRLKLFNWFQQILYWASSIGLAFWIYSNIEKVDKILPDGKGLIDQMWILIIAFLYAVVNKLNIGEYRTIKRKDNYLTSRYDKFHAKYNDIIQSAFNNSFYEALTYAIMIYEDFNRPYLIRKIEDLSFRITKKPHTLGIMQVKTERYINDEKSLRLAIAKIKNDNNAYINQERENAIREGNTNPVINNIIYKYCLISHIADKYNGGNPKYKGEISDIFNKINQLYYRNQIPENFTIFPMSQNPGQPN